MTKPDAKGGDARGPAVGVLYTAGSARSRENELVARYVGLCLAAGGLCGRVAVVGVSGDARNGRAGPGTRAEAASALRSDGVVIEEQRLPADAYKETGDLDALADCTLWVLLLDTSATLSTAEKLDKRCGLAVGSDAMAAD